DAPRRLPFAPRLVRARGAGGHPAGATGAARRTRRPVPVHRRAARRGDDAARAVGCESDVVGARLRAMSVLERIEANIRANELIEPGGEVLCLVSGGPDSTCLYFALRELGYEVSALHVNYGLRGCESDDDARFCERELGAEVVDFDARGATEAGPRAIRYAQAPGRLRATGHTATDQVETILYRLVT